MEPEAEDEEWSGVEKPGSATAPACDLLLPAPRSDGMERHGAAGASTGGSERDSGRGRGRLRREGEKLDLEEKDGLLLASSPPRARDDTLFSLAVAP